MNRLVGLMKLGRPLNAAIMAVGVGIGALLAGSQYSLALIDTWQLFLAMIAAVAIGTGANAVNDVFDHEIDLVNRPQRPLPSGQATPRAAWWMWGILSAMGVVMAVALSWFHAMIAGATVALLFFYSSHLKRRPLVGNVAVALVIGLALPFGGLIPLLDGYGHAAPLIAGAGFAFVTTLAREIVKDIEDMSGDASTGARTFPLVVGSHMAAAVAVAIILATIAVLPVARLLGLGPLFLVFSLPTAGLLAAAAWWLLGTITQDEEARRLSAGRASSVVKLAMVAGLAALAVSAW